MTTPPDPATDIELSHLGRLLRRVDAAAEDGAGWHEHSAGLCVFIVYDHHDEPLSCVLDRMLAGTGEAIRTARYTARPLLPARVLERTLRDGHATIDPAGGPQEAQLLRTFVLNVAYAGNLPADAPVDTGLLESFRDLLHQRGVLAFIARYEAWASHQGVTVRAALTGRQRIADMPDAVEMRRVMAVDGRDRIHLCQRRRGEPAELAMDAPIRGDISTSLRILMDYARDRLPSPDEFEQRYPTLLQVYERG